MLKYLGGLVESMFPGSIKGLEMELNGSSERNS